MTNFRPMLAAKANPAKLRFPLSVQPKLDGIRVSIVGGRALTRTLKEVPNREVFEFLSDPRFEGLDGEILVGSPTADDAYRRTCSFVMAPDKTGEPWCFHVFDKHDEPAGFLARYDLADEQVNAAEVTPHLSLVTTWRVLDAERLAELEAQFIADGFEGAILRDPAGNYKFGRASATKGELLKLKRFSDSEAIVVGYVEEQHNGNEAVTNALGRTERSTAKAGKTGKGRLGKLIVRDCYSGVEFGVGSGFSAAERVSLWADRDSLVGKMIRYRFFPVGVKDKPRHPTYDGMRSTIDV